jgi:hypothetical protein
MSEETIKQNLDEALTVLKDVLEVLTDPDADNFQAYFLEEKIKKVLDKNEVD